jgi:hypothetical protein
MPPHSKAPSAHRTGCQVWKSQFSRTRWGKGPGSLQENLKFSRPGTTLAAATSAEQTLMRCVEGHGDRLLQGAIGQRRHNVDVARMESLVHRRFLGYWSFLRSNHIANGVGQLPGCGQAALILGGEPGRQLVFGDAQA